MAAASTHLTRVTALPVRSDDSPTLASRVLREHNDILRACHSLHTRGLRPAKVRE